MPDSTRVLVIEDVGLGRFDPPSAVEFRQLAFLEGPLHQRGHVSRGRQRVREGSTDMHASGPCGRHEPLQQGVPLLALDQVEHAVADDLVVFLVNDLRRHIRDPGTDHHASPRCRREESRDPSI